MKPAFCFIILKNITRVIYQSTMFTLRFFAFGLLVATAAAQGSTDKPEVEIITEKTYVNQDGYNFVYKTSDGVSRQEEAHLITVGDKQGIGVKGSYSYTAPDGQQYEVTFTADDKGYKPTIRVTGNQ